MVAHELFHFLKRKKFGKKGYVAIKLDMKKAYDRVCWDFLFQVLEKMGFNSGWIGWVKECVNTVKFSISANGEQVCNVSPCRGLRQGDPISPYLFLMVANVLSIMINKAIYKKSLMGVRMRKKCPIVSHLLFADDSLVFLEANPKYCSNLLFLLSCFGEASGLEINAQKSSLYFSPNTTAENKEEIGRILGMPEMEMNAKYLGLPIFWGKSKKEVVAYIKDKITRKVQSWNRRTLPQASKEILIKSVAQATPMYPMMCFKMPKSLCADLDTVIGKFWWENGENRGKCTGGLGIK